jgi:type II secretory pathway component PulF
MVKIAAFSPTARLPRSCVSVSPLILLVTALPTFTSVFAYEVEISTLKRSLNGMMKTIGDESWVTVLAALPVPNL